MGQEQAFEHILYRQEGPVAFVEFNRPKVMNALNAQLISEVLSALDSLPADTRVLIVRGSGTEAFAAGADLQELEERTMWTELDYGPRRTLAARLERGPFITVAALNGLALGGGFELALACHLRIASDAAELGLPELRLGLIPGNGGTIRLPRIVGTGLALQKLLLSERFSAEEALRLGLVNWVVPAAGFDAEVARLGERLARLPGVAVRAVLDCVMQSGELPLSNAIELEHRWFQLCLGSDDRREGVKAFKEKRHPVFHGKARYEAAE